MRMRFLMVLASLLCAVPALAGGEERHVVMISIDGMMPASYLEAEARGLKLPNLRRLMTEGAYAHGVVGVLPTVTFPSHTTLISGVPPRLHGILSNHLFDPEGAANDAWYWYARDVRVPTLVSAARSRGLTTAAVFWPVSVGLGADFNVPEFSRTGSLHPTDTKLLDALSTPPGLLSTLERFRGRPLPYPLKDDERTEAAIYLWKTQRPHLLLLHIAEVDSAEHEFGPWSPEAKAALEKSDALLGQVRAAIEESGLADRTLLAVVSDHGFVAVQRELRPNVLLRQAGLVEVDEKGKVKSWRAWFHSDGGTTALHLRDGGDTAAVERVKEIFRPLVNDPASGLQEVLESYRIAALGGAAEVALVLDARDGFTFSNTATGEWSAPTTLKGNHGYAPDRPAVYASLLIAAPGLYLKGDLGMIQMTSIAPTLAAWLGLQLAPEAGPPLPLALRAAKAVEPAR
jgi:predicted AlkP superfamily pyrophosphatase or phosphodiesterase